MIILLDMGVFEHINQWDLFSIFGWPCGVRGPVFPSSAKPCDIQVPNKKSMFSIRCYSSSIINPFWSKTKQQKQQTSIYIHDFPVITPICSKNHLQHHSTSIFPLRKTILFSFPLDVRHRCDGFVGGAPHGSSARASASDLRPDGAELRSSIHVFRWMDGLCHWGFLTNIWYMCCKYGLM